MTNQSSVEKSKDLVVAPAPHISGAMSKNRLMLYTFAALMVITVITAVLWWHVPVPTELQVSQLGLSNAWVMPLGAILLVSALVAVGVAVGIDFLVGKIAADSEINTMSAAVFGLIVTLSYSYGLPQMAQVTDVMPIETLTAPMIFAYVALISGIGLLVFKKLQGMAGRKFVNPAAAAKFLVLLPFITSVFIVKDHFADWTEGGLSVPKLAGPLGWGDLAVGGNGLGSFSSNLQGCYSDPTLMNPQSIESVMLFTKFHGWAGGASSIAVIIVGIALFVLARKYIKWRITATYFVSIIAMSLVMTGIYGGDALIRIIFEIFIGSSIFLAFFMATDPATTPYTAKGQIIFGVGLGILTVIIQTYMNFFGGALLALLIMNLTVPLIDRIGLRKPFGR